MIRFDFDTYIKNFISESEYSDYNHYLSDIDSYLNSNKDGMGWYCLDSLSHADLINDINSTADYIRNNCDVFIVIGIGGSYLGASAVIEALKPYFYNHKEYPEIYFLGTSLSSDYYYDLINLIKNKDVIVNVISKSGTTLETDIAYSLLMDFMVNKYSEKELQKRIIITTDKEKGLLREEVKQNGYKSFVIPSNIGGRYSVLTPVGLLPIAVANINLNELFKGAREANKEIDYQTRYAIIRNILSKKDKIVEAFVVYEPKLYAFTEWLKQLYGESLGKEEKGILPISLINTRDLHSLGQFVQEGNKILFETVINVEKSNRNINVDKYNKLLSEINNIASISTSKAHLKGAVPNNIITVEKLDEYTLGYLLQFFMASCAISGYIENVNPFNQEGVEEYKNIMRSLL
jgi:glucose-6-phosphate isomerase